MDAKKEIDGFKISAREVLRNGPNSVASNRLRSSGNPTEIQIGLLAKKIERAFSASRPVIASIPRFQKE